VGDRAPGGRADAHGPAGAARRAGTPALAAGVGAPRRLRGISYRASLVLSLSLLVVATGLAVSVLAFRGAREMTTRLAHNVFQEVSDHAVTKTRGFLLRAVPIAQTLGDLSDLGLATDDPDRLARQLAVVLRANPGVSWVSYSNEAGGFVGAFRTRAGELRVNRSRIDPDGRTSVVEHDVLDDGSWRPFRTEADSGFDPRVRPYYVRAREAGRLVWPPPYVFYDQGVAGVTCANPLYDEAGKLCGVLTVDFDLDTLSRFVEELSVSRNSRLFIMTPDGTLLAHPANRPVAAKQAAAATRAGAGLRGRGELLTVRELSDPLLAAFDAQLAPGDRTPGPGGADRARQFEFNHDGTAYYARSTAFTINGDLTWIVGAVAPQSDFLAAARRTSALSAGASLGAMLVAVAVAMVLARRVSGPILSLVSFMNGIGAGNLTGRPRLGGAREFRQLSDALDQMLHDLRDRTRLRSAMAVAMEVQQGLLPARPPNVRGLDVAGFSAYCDETGGDYFDYLVLDRHGDRLRPGDVTAPDGPSPGERGAAREGSGLLVAIGDVVGHGIGSALVMAGARGVLHSRATRCGHLGELMTHLNDELVPDLGGHRFITMLLWYLDPGRGTACWANAGHDPALVYDPHADRFEESGRGGIPLGIEAGHAYEEYAFGPVRPGQVFVLGTDGIWETVDDAGEFYGKGRLRDAVRAAAGGTAAEIAAAVRRDLDAFRGARHQRDDVTLVVVKACSA
jgi:sigma-B regulation protein RsbU (phosphoserine phosphatase)